MKERIEKALEKVRSAVSEDEFAAMGFEELLKQTLRSML